MSIDLSVIVPRFREEEADVFPLLASIAGQAGVGGIDMEVIVVTDGGGAGPLPDAFLGLFPSLDVREARMDGNRGPGLARQRGIDEARGRWLMFADADDRLHNVGAVQSLYEAGEGGGYDLVNSPWLEETPLDASGRMGYVRHEDEWTWMHGKLIRAGYLRDKGIRHHPSLRVHEDTYILSLATAQTSRVGHVKALTYLWTWREDSITRRNGGAYTYEAMPTFVDSCFDAMAALHGKAAPETLMRKAVQSTIYVYYLTNQPDWDAHEDWRAATQGRLAERMRGWWDVWDAAPPELVAQILEQERARSCRRPETETIAAFAARMREAV